jgi:hypothetical protein
MLLLLSAARGPELANTFDALVMWMLSLVQGSLLRIEEVVGRAVHRRERQGVPGSHLFSKVAAGWSDLVIHIDVVPAMASIANICTLRSQNNCARHIQLTLVSNHLLELRLETVWVLHALLDYRFLSRVHFFTECGI